MNRPKTDYSILAVTNTLRALEELAERGELGVTELARSLGLQKNNAFRILATLEPNGYVEQVGPKDSYRLGFRCLEVGRAYARAHSVGECGHRFLERLAQETAETVHLGILVDFTVGHLDGISAPRLLAPRLRVGERLACHNTALGKVLLGCGPESLWAKFDRAVVSPGRLRPATPATIVDRDKLFEHLRTVRARGWAVDFEECEAGLACAAAPAYDAEGKVVAALSVSGASCRFGWDQLEGEIVPLVTRVAGDLSRALGYHG